MVGYVDVQRRLDRAQCLAKQCVGRLAILRNDRPYLARFPAVAAENEPARFAHPRRLRQARRERTQQRLSAGAERGGIKR